MGGVGRTRTAVFWWLSAMAICSTLFLAIPELDLHVSGWFGTPSGFPLSESLLLEGVRNFMLLATGGVAYLALILLVLRNFFKKLQVLNARFLVFVVTCAALGPGIIVNGLLKRFSGRVRPRNTDVFGAEGTFSPFLDFTGACGSNCSFVSAEASALATITAVLVISVIPYLPTSVRPRVQIGVLSVATFGSLLRVIVGAHYLSDVLFAWLIIFPMVFGLCLAFGRPRLLSSVEAARLSSTEPAPILVHPPIETNSSGRFKSL